MLALDKPFISNEMEIGTVATGNICLEYGSATQLYLVPLILQEEQVIWEVFFINALEGSHLIMSSFYLGHLQLFT